MSRYAISGVALPLGQAAYVPARNWWSGVADGWRVERLADGFQLANSHAVLTLGHGGPAVGSATLRRTGLGVEFEVEVDDLEPAGARAVVEARYGPRRAVSVRMLVLRERREYGLNSCRVIDALHVKEVALEERPAYRAAMVTGVRELPHSGARTRPDGSAGARSSRPAAEAVRRSQALSARLRPYGAGECPRHPEARACTCHHRLAARVGGG